MLIPAVKLPEYADFAAAVKAGLGVAGQKSLPPSFLYDEVGSALFEVITTLPEYGVTRAEERVLSCYGTRLAPLMLDRSTVTSMNAATGPGPTGHSVQIAPCAPSARRSLRVIELGSGSGRKTRFILEALAKAAPISYCPIDISSSALRQCASALGDIPGVTVTPLEREYLPGLMEAGAARKSGEPTLVLFLGSTIGNFPSLSAVHFLKSVRATLQLGDALLLGADLLKPVDELLLAYDDPIGVTAAFNLNLLARMNRELDANFAIDGFEHVAKFNPKAGSIEMHLRSRRAQCVTIPASGLSVHFLPGETIWTESSHKYRALDIEKMARDAGFDPRAQWIDDGWPFAETFMAVK
jgi:L-histidine N-alpha-methyltransferase